MAKIPAHVLDRIRERPEHFPLTLEPIHAWRSSPDEGGHTHCESCCATIYRGDQTLVLNLASLHRSVMIPSCHSSVAGD